MVILPDSLHLVPAMGCFALTSHPHGKSTGPQRSLSLCLMETESSRGSCTSGHFSAWLHCTSMFIWMGCFLSGTWLLMRCSSLWDTGKSKKRVMHLTYITNLREKNGGTSIWLLRSLFSFSDSPCPLHNHLRAGKRQVSPLLFSICPLLKTLSQR